MRFYILHIDLLKEKLLRCFFFKLNNRLLIIFSIFYSKSSNSQHSRWNKAWYAETGHNARIQNSSRSWDYRKGTWVLLRSTHRALCVCVCVCARAYV